MLNRKELLHQIFNKDCPKGTPEYARLANLVSREEVPFVKEGRLKLFRPEDVPEITERLRETSNDGYVSVLSLSSLVDVPKSTLQTWFDSGKIAGFHKGRGVKEDRLKIAMAQIEKLKGEKSNILGKHENVAHEFPCKVCGNLFNVKPSHYENGHKITCSDECQVVYRDTKKIHLGSLPNEPIEISSELAQIIDGELLGDGCIRMSGRCKNAMFTYATANLEYSQYLHGIFSPLNPGTIYTTETCSGCNKDKKYTGYNWVTKTNPSLTEIYHRWYIDGFKQVPGDIELTPLVVRHWYIGDGCLVTNKSTGQQSICISTDGFVEEDVDLLISKLTKLGIHGTKKKAGQNVTGDRKFEIYIRSNSLARFLDYIGECPVDSYAYKWALSNYYREIAEYPYTTGDIDRALGKHKGWTKNRIARGYCEGLDMKKIGGRIRFSKEGFDMAVGN